MKRLAFLHPFLVAIAPTLFLWSHNYQQVEWADLLITLPVFAGAAGLCLAALWLLRRDYERCAIIVSLLLIVLFSYGHLFELVWGFHFFKSRDAVHWTLGAYLAAMLAAASALSWRTSRNLQQVGSFLTITPALLILFSIANIAREARFAAAAGKHIDEIASVLPADEDGKPDAPGVLPDIYYVILDSYGRADNLSKLYGYDNTDFINYLKDKGFYVAHRSWSNYPATIYSLSSSLNMQYLNGIQPESRAGERQMLKMLRKPLIARYLQSKGYLYVHFNTYAFETRKSDIADITYDYTPLLGREFIRILLRTTALMGLEKYQPTQLIAENTLYNFEKLRELPAMPGPTFAFVHFFPPHHPFVFDRTGTYIGQGQSLEIPHRNLQKLYVDQLIYMNKRIKELVDYLLKSSPAQPIIIIQADHGGAYLGLDFFAKEIDRLAILNAFCVPENCRQHLYPSITPVNTFRILLRDAFGEDIDTLPDESYVVENGEFIKSSVTKRAGASHKS